LARAVLEGRGMSSVRNMAAAQAYVEPVVGNPGHLPRPEALPTDPLSDLWENLVRGRLRPLHEDTTRDSVRFVSQVTLGPPALCADEASLVRSVFCGDPRKALACDLGIAVSTATGRYLRALAKLDLTDGMTPLVLVLSAQSRAGLVRIPSARMYVDHQGFRCLSVSVPRPDTGCLVELTPVERQVAQWLIEGGTRETIADRRSTSVHTVAGQVHAIFHALGVTGRYALVRRAGELGCFSQPAMSVA
jgi:DNA-binding CsgD family transcriptional regulator